MISMIIMQRRNVVLSIILTCTFSLPVNANQQTQVVVYQSSINPNSVLHRFPKELLKRIMHHADKSAELRPIEINGTYPRSAKLMREGSLHVGWRGVRPKNSELGVRDIRYPIFKGLMGYRLVMVHKENLHLLQSRKNLASLKKLIIGQRIGWPEVDIYRNSGLDVLTTDDALALFKMLSGKRYDLLPRSIVEVRDEYNRVKSMGIAIDPHLVIRYPHAMFFFVHETNDKLYNAIHRGFKKVIETGEYETLFSEHVKPYVNEANFDSRTLIDVPNPHFEITEEEKGLYYAGI